MAKVVSLRPWNAIAAKDIFTVRKVFVLSILIYFNTPLLIIYLSAMETFLCCTKYEAPPGWLIGEVV